MVHALDIDVSEDGLGPPDIESILLYERLIVQSPLEPYASPMLDGLGSSVVTRCTRYSEIRMIICGQKKENDQHR